MQDDGFLTRQTTNTPIIKLQNTMEQNNNNALVPNEVLSKEVVAMQSQFALAVQQARDLKVTDNACAAFETVAVVHNLRMALTDEVVKQVFMPLMNTKIGFKTDKAPTAKNPNPQLYTAAQVKDCIIDAICIGLLPTGNQFNIIAGQMYPTKEGYTALLKKIGCKYIISVGQDSQKPEAPFAEIPCKINYDYNGDKGGYTFIATVKKDSYSSMDQLRGKAERRAKKSLYEYLTGCDFGDADEDSSAPISAAPNAGGQISMPAHAMQPAPSPAAQNPMQSAGAKAESNWRTQQASTAAQKPNF